MTIPSALPNLPFRGFPIDALSLSQSGRFLSTSPTNLNSTDSIITRLPSIVVNCFATGAAGASGSAMFSIVIALPVAMTNSPKPNISSTKSGLTFPFLTTMSCSM
jgi:hypothetical protein